VSCNAGGLHTDNSYSREFDLTAFGIGGAFGVTQVEFGVEQARATGNQPVTVNLYTKINPAAPLIFANPFRRIGFDQCHGDGSSLTLLTIPVVGNGPHGPVLVVEIFTPDGQTAGNSFIGSNNLGQTKLSHLAAAVCGVPELTATGNLGFPACTSS
jgi:hypothetical protein